MKKSLKLFLAVFIAAFAILNMNLKANQNFEKSDLKLENIAALNAANAEDGDPCQIDPSSQCLYNGDPRGWCIYCPGCSNIEGYVPMTVTGACMQ